MNIIYIQKIFMKVYNIIMQKPCIWILKKWGLTVGKNLNIQKPNNSVCAGIPCKKISDLDEYLEKVLEKDKYDASYHWNNITKNKKMKEELNGKIGLIV